MSLIRLHPENTKIFFDWFVNSNKAVLYLSGPAGVGKTAFIQACVNKLEASLRRREIILYDFSDNNAGIKTGLLSLGKSISAVTPRLVVLDGIYDAVGIGEIMEEVVRTLPPGCKAIVSSRTDPAGTWLVSPVLRQATFHLKLNRTAAGTTKSNPHDPSPEKVFHRYMREVDSRELLPYLETAAAA